MKNYKKSPLKGDLEGGSGSPPLRGSRERVFVFFIFHFSFYNLLYEPRQHHPPIRRPLGVCHGCNLIFQRQSWQEQLL